MLGAAVLLALAGALHAPELAVAGLGLVVVALLGREVLLWRTRETVWRAVTAAVAALSVAVLISALLIDP